MGSPWPFLGLRKAAWVGGSLLVLTGRFPRVQPGDLVATAVSGEQVVEAEGCCLLARSSEGQARRTADKVVILRLPGSRALHDSSPSLELRSADKTISIHSRRLEDVLTDATTLLAEDLANLDPGTREELRRAVLSLAGSDLEGPGSFTLSKDLYRIREALREPLSKQTIGTDEPQIAGIDTFLGLEERAFWIAGWTRDEDGTLTRLTAISPEGHEADLNDVFRLRRPDVEEKYGVSARQGEKHGFIKFFELSAPSRLGTGWKLQWTDSSGAGIEVDAPSPLREPETARDVLLDYFSQECVDLERLRRDQIHPALVRLQERHRQSVEIESVAEYGAPAASSTVSVVVTLYGRIDFLRHQMLHFARDAALREADLIYVLDSPELADSLHDLASQVHAFHGIPFRIARLTRNAGFPVANNLGASIARGRILLLLNSDVLPDRPGWLEKMVNFYDATPEIGALGPKLLFEDESTIQHAGMYFEREAGSGHWGNLHYFKGFHRSFSPASINRPVPAVTGACLMIDRALYEELGGLNSHYIQIGYEDSDLCLRLVDRGRRNWYLADAELYHLEGQAYPTASRVASTKYNTWLQTYLWAPLVEQIMSEQSGAALPGATTSGSFGANSAAA